MIGSGSGFRIQSLRCCDQMILVFYALLLGINLQGCRRFVITLIVRGYVDQSSSDRNCGSTSCRRHSFQSDSATLAIPWQYLGNCFALISNTNAVGPTYLVLLFNIANHHECIFTGVFRHIIPGVHGGYKLSKEN